MKIPFIDSILYNQMKLQEIIPEDNQEPLSSFENVIHTKARVSTIINNFNGKIISVYNGKQSKRIWIKDIMLGYKIGCFCLTKKIGRSIHNSAHNRKRIEKIRRKITQRKIRKTPGKKIKNKNKNKKKR